MYFFSFLNNEYNSLSTDSGLCYENEAQENVMMTFG